MLAHSKFLPRFEIARRARRRQTGLAIIPLPLAGATVNPQDATLTAERGSLRAAPEVSTIRDVNLACAISSGSRRSVPVRF